ncbi:hypothetical protein BGZ98_008422 [Dissophora globulifera]|nr:hypothetical protein BGZ98_008422 [Dissophora globulifera]
MSAIATMEAAVVPLSEQAKPSYLAYKHIQPRSTTSPLLPINYTTFDRHKDSGSSSVASTPTPSLSSSTSSSTLVTPDAVSFSFSSPLFYDQKLYIYQSLKSLYQRLGGCLQKHPGVLRVLQYSIAITHGLTIYLLSVVISVAQLIMITCTIENLDWIHSYKPLMCEWDSYFPGFVFPALDVEDSEDIEQKTQHKQDLNDPKDSQYWKSRATLQSGNDLVANRYHLEEDQRMLAIHDSMSSIIRKRLFKYQHWLPTAWAVEDGIIPEADAAEYQRQQDELNQDTEDTESTGVSSKIRRALVRTLSGNLVPAPSKRVTFNENVLVFGRRRSSMTPEMSPPSMPPMTPIASDPATHSSTPAAENPKAVGSRQAAFSPTSLMPSMDQEALAREEAFYQQSIATEDVNGSRSSSPLFEANSRRSLASPNTSLSPVLALPSAFSPTSPVFPDVSETTSLKRTSTLPSKIGSLFHGHQNNSISSPRSTNRNSATFSEASTVHPIPRNMAAYLVDSENGASNPSRDTPSPRSSLSLSKLPQPFTLCKNRAIDNVAASSLELPTESSDAKSSTTDSLKSTDRKHKNFMYRVVHPQRYKREMQEQSEEERRQGMLALAQIQQQHIRDSYDGARTCGNNVFCGDPYYYATSAEYVEGLGAPNSMISTSVGISFPEELSSKKLKDRRKAPRPLVVDPAFRSTPLTSDDHGPDSDVNSAPHHSQHRSIFGQDSKHAATRSAPQSPTRAHHHFSHPGHRVTQSTSSLIYPSGPPSASVASESKSPLASEAGHCPTFHTTSSIKTPAGARGVLSQALSSDSMKFTTFTALGMPANPPAQPITPMINGMTNSFSVAALKSNSHETEHTSFAAFGFPSPVSSPGQSISTTSTGASDWALTMNGHDSKNENQMDLLETDHTSDREELESLQSQQYQSQFDHGHQQHRELLLEDNDNNIIYRDGEAAHSDSEENSRLSLTASDDASGSILGNEVPQTISSVDNADSTVQPDRDLAAGKHHHRVLGFVRRLSLKHRK